MRKLLILLDELFNFRLLALSVGALLFIAIGARFAFALDATAPTAAATSTDFLAILIDHSLSIAEALLAVAATWIIGQVIRWLGITNQAQSLQVESQLRDALHFAAENGLKYAFAKLGAPPSLQASASVIADAIAYVKDKNPDTVAALGVDDTALEHIILSKLPSIAALSFFSAGLTGSGVTAPVTLPPTTLVTSVSIDQAAPSSAPPVTTAPANA